MVALIVIIIGSVALKRLPIDLMPDITYPTISITATYENASPEEIEELVTRPIEEAMSAVPGVEEVSSNSSEGRSRVRVLFSWGTDLDTASNDVRDRLDRIISRLPEDMDRPTLRKFDPSSMPIVMLGASSNLDPIELRRIIDEQIKYRIERVPGVAALDIYGGRTREIRVSLNSGKIKALNLPLNKIISSISESNVVLPAGAVERGYQDVIVRTPGEYVTVEEIANTVVAKLEDVPIRLKDIASVKDTSQKVTRAVRVNGRPGINLSVTKQSGKNTVEVAKNVLAEVEKINEDMPQIRLVPIVDSSSYIKRSISSVGTSALYGGLFAVLVLLFFLRNFRSTAIVAVAIPISIVAAFGLIYFSGFTLNIMTLGGLALGVGMLVDNAIVVLENIYRLREDGLSQEESAVAGSQEVASAVVASTLTTVVVFLPLVFMRGMAGVMFKQLAMVVSFALLCSLAVALTLIPMFSSKFLQLEDEKSFTGENLLHKLYRAIGKVLTEMEELYKKMLKHALTHCWVVLITVFIVLVVSVGVGLMIGRELVPQSDEGEVRITGEMEVGTKLAVVDEQFKKIETVVDKEIPEMENKITTVGGSGWTSGSHTGQLRISLKGRGQRKRSSEKIASDIRQQLSHIPGMIVRTRAGTGMFTRMLMRGAGTADRVQVEIRGYDLTTADNLASQVKKMVEGVDGVTDAQVSRETGIPEQLILVNRLKAADLGFNVSQVADMLRISLGGSTAGYFREGGSEHRIFVQLEDADKMSMEDILNLSLVNNYGQSVSLRNLVDMKPHSGPVTIERKSQERIVTVSANTSDRDMSLIIKDVQNGLQSIPVPGDFSMALTGEYEEQQEAFRELVGVFILALLLVYMVMVSLYESLRDPFVVMFSIPPAAIGVVWLLFLTGTTFNIQSFIGCIMLGGIVVNNAIVLVDHIILLRRRDNFLLKDAIEEAGRRRLRPILMTSFTTILALIPMALGFGEGGEFQAPLARAVIGGLLSATFITLFVVPVVYYLFERRIARRAGDTTA